MDCRTHRSRPGPSRPAKSSGAINPGRSLRAGAAIPLSGDEAIFPDSGIAAPARRDRRGLIAPELFEQVLQSRYLGTKRFSLEGVTALIPLLDSILDNIAEHGGVESVMAMSHLGRLNVMVHAVCKAPHEVVAGFEDTDPRSVPGAG